MSTSMTNICTRIERGLLTREQLDEILQPTMLTLPRKPLAFD
ncbi:hypothetical protein [Burkholderia vietnamiensis]|nr:hypothetical protein [Burkholderia vietnamiensis]MDN8035883.1 hypothetical protein [Burkholderia vietnamiensis]